MQKNQPAIQFSSNPPPKQIMINMRRIEGKGGAFAIQNTGDGNWGAESRDIKRATAFCKACQLIYMINVIIDGGGLMPCRLARGQGR